MKKIVAVAALVAASFAAPTLPAHAATMTDADANCLVLPMLKRECMEQAREIAMAGPAAVAAAVEEGAEEMGFSPPPMPMWFTCTPAPAGSGYLLDC